MPYLPTSDQWLHQSHLLLEARPSTTRVTTKYTIHRPSDASTPSPALATTTTSSAATPAPQKYQKSKALLTLRTYDPVSGVCLKYKTAKAWEVGRLVGALGGLGRRMGGLKERDNGGQERAAEGGEAEGMEGDDVPATGAAREKETGRGQGGKEGGGTATEGGGKGKKKKKKGKR